METYATNSGWNDPEVQELAAALSRAPLPRRLALVRSRLPGRLVFTTSFGLEDQAITHAICTADPGADIEIVTLDTGRLFPETYDLWAETEERYGRRIPAYAPDAAALEALISDQGVNGFRRSVADSSDLLRACARSRRSAGRSRAPPGGSRA